MSNCKTSTVVNHISGSFVLYYRSTTKRSLTSVTALCYTTVQPQKGHSHQWQLCAMLQYNHKKVGILQKMHPGRVNNTAIQACTNVYAFCKHMKPTFLDFFFIRFCQEIHRDQSGEYILSILLGIYWQKPLKRSRQWSKYVRYAYPLFSLFFCL